MMRAPSFWYPQSVASFGQQATRLSLEPLAFAYASVGRLKRHLTVPERLSVPVFCIGNFTAGGAGKTPTAIAIAKRLTGLGEQVHFLSRGYGGSEEGPLRVDPDRHTSGDVGDEPLLLSLQAPTWISRDRVAGALAAEQAGASVILLDDGFLNPALFKDLSLLVVDTKVGVGNGSVLPAGPLREPIGDALARTDAIIALGEQKCSDTLTRDAQRREISVFGAQLCVDKADAARIKGKHLIAYAGIGRPSKFFDTLMELGASLTSTHAFPDHHVFSDADAEMLLADAKKQNAVLITTEKDAARLQGQQSPQCQALLEQSTVLPVSAVFEDYAALDALLRQGLATARESHIYAPPGTTRDR